MKTLTITENRDTLKYKLQWNFRHLSDKDLHYVKGKERSSSQGSRKSGEP